MSDDRFWHEPVLLARVVELLSAVPAGVVVDATLGGGGHAAALLSVRADLHLIGIDRDADALAASRERLASFSDRCTFVHARFDDLSSTVADFGSTGVTGVLFDLGVSSPQLDRAERGFSYRHDAPLDMRMDQRQQLSAATVVNDYPAEELARVLDQYGDERFSRRIAAAVVERRPVRTTGELADIVRDAIPAATRRKGGHPARKSFQAIRVEVNDELRILAGAVDQAIDLLLPGGRCVVLSYHSGEDRIVKERFRRAESGGCICPPLLPCVCGAEPKVKLIRRGAEKASVDEVERNRRAESVRLRAVESVTIRPLEDTGVAS